MRRRHGARALTGLALALTAPTALADPQPDTATIAQINANNPGLFTFAYGAESSPALNLLGLSPSKVQVASKLTPFALSVPSLFDGSSGASIGLDVAPAYLTQHFWPIYLDQYPNYSQPMRWLIRSHVELAGTNGSASSDPTKIQQSGFAGVVYTSLLDVSDPAIGGAAYFKQCMAPYQSRISQALRTDAEDRTKYVGLDVENAAIDLDALDPKNGLPNDRVDGILQSDAPAILRAYALADPAIAPSLPLAAHRAIVQEPTALAELQDVFRRYDSADPTERAHGADFAHEIDVVAALRHEAPLAPALALDLATERAEVTAFAASLPSTDSLKGALADLMRSPAFGGPVDGASDPGQLDAQVAYVKTHLSAITLAVSKYQSQKLKEYQSTQEQQGFQMAGVVKAASDCATATATFAASQPDINVGLGYVEAGKPGALSHLHSGGETAYVAGRFHIYSDIKDRTTADVAAGNANYIMLGGSLNYTDHASVTTGKATTPIMNADLFGAWLGIQGYSSRLRGSFQVGYTDTHADDQANAALSTHGWRWLAGGSVKLNDSLWIGASYGTANGSTAKLNDRELLVTLTFSAPKTTNDFAPAPPPAPMGH